MPTVRIPSSLRRYTGGQSQLAVARTCVSAVIDNLEARYPDVKRRICQVARSGYDENGQVKRYVNVFINQNEIRSIPKGTQAGNGAESPVDDRDEISILPAMAGGQ